MTYWIQNYDARNPLAVFRRELNDLFTADSAWAPSYDVTEGEGHYLLSLDVPGIPRDDIKIEAHENTVTIAGERRSERRNGKFQRSFRLPEGVDASKIEANYQDGVLRLAIPKAEAAKPVQIKISNDAGFFAKLPGEGKESVAS